MVRRLVFVIVAGIVGIGRHIKFGVKHRQYNDVIANDNYVIANEVKQSQGLVTPLQSVNMSLRAK